MPTKAANDLKQKALSVVRIPGRAVKPRLSGLTIVADRGLGRHGQEDLLDLAAEYIDIAKFAMGLSRLLEPELIRAKLARYAQHDIQSFFAGELSELAIIQGVAADYYQSIHDLGGWGVEISNAQIAMGIEEKCHYIELAQGKGLAVIAECGRKGGVAWAGSFKLVAAEVRACLNAGAYRVLIQAEGVNEGVEVVNESLIQDLVGEFGLEQLVFQAKESELCSWFLTTFGGQVNLDVDSHQVLDLEARRRGLRKRGVFGLMSGQ